MRPPAYLLDTNVISNRRNFENAHVRDWVRIHAGLIRISVITVAEMKRGLVRLEAKALRLKDANVDRQLAFKQAWYREIVTRYDSRIEPIDLAAAERWGEVSERFPSLKDADKALAAQALAKGFGVATENLGDFRVTGLSVANPFDPGTWDFDTEPDPLDAAMRGP